MCPQKIMDGYSVVDLKKFSESLIYVDAFTGWLRLRKIALAYAHYDLFKQLRFSTPIVRVYLRKPSLVELGEYSFFLILPTDVHFLRIDIDEERASECLGVPKEWFDKKGIYKDYAKAYIQEMPGLDIKPF